MAEGSQPIPTECLNNRKRLSCRHCRHTRAVWPSTPKDRKYLIVKPTYWKDVHSSLLIYRYSSARQSRVHIPSPPDSLCLLLRYIRPRKGSHNIPVRVTNVSFPVDLSPIRKKKVSLEIYYHLHQDCKHRLLNEPHRA